MSLHPNEVLLAPVVSEKSYSLIGGGKYVFKVHPDSHKTQIRQAVEEIFGVRVRGVRTQSVKSKPKRRGYTSGKTRTWKKAIVELHPEDSIELFEGQEIGE